MGLCTTYTRGWTTHNHRSFHPPVNVKWKVFSEYLLSVEVTKNFVECSNFSKCDQGVIVEFH